MYDYVKDKKFLKALKNKCQAIINDLVVSINNEGKMRVRSDLVGSGSKNLIMRNEKGPVDLDYNLVIVRSIGFDINDCEAIKEYVRNKFDKVLAKHSHGKCFAHDSKSALSTGFLPPFPKWKEIQFSVDLAITKKKKSKWHRLIHEKTGDKKNDRWYWNEAPNSKGLDEKVKKIKVVNHWEEVREVYKIKKNRYLKRTDDKHPSFICYIEAVNEVYNDNFGQQ